MKAGPTLDMKQVEGTMIEGTAGDGRGRGAPTYVDFLNIQEGILIVTMNSIDTEIVIENETAIETGTNTAGETAP
jgi:hypothetical protein